MRENDTHAVRLSDLGVALVLLTRLPVPVLPDAAFARGARAAWAYPLVGLVVGGIAALIAAAAMALGLPTVIAAGLAVAAMALATGAMHEDGLADTADGFWGGTTRDRRLEIMADSRIGAYGVLALILVTGLRWAALSHALEASGPWVLVALGALTRAGLPAMMAVLPRARPGGLSDSVGAPPLLATVLAAGIGLVCTLPLIGLWPVLAAMLALFTLGLIARTKIGGQTGDTLGAGQQMSDLAALLVLAARA